MKDKNCLQCGKLFKPKRNTSKYCSQECQWLSMTKRDLSTHVCKVCGKEFTLNRTGLKGYYCSRECSYADKDGNPMYSLQNECRRLKELAKENERVAKENKRIAKENEKRIRELIKMSSKFRSFECKECGNTCYTTSDKETYCNGECRKKYYNRIKGNYKDKRLSRNGKSDYSITLAKLFIRDNGICKCCKKELTFECDFNSNDYPSIDHIKPIAKGGLHEWDNVQLLCRGCNSKKSDRYTPHASLKF